jgi:hypothetical protein
MGIVLNYLTTLEVIGRKSRRTILLPVVIAIHDGERYLVSMFGVSVQWVQKRASGEKAVLPGGGREDVLLEDLPGSVRLKAYLQRAPGARPRVPINKDATLEFQMVAREVPAFRINGSKVLQPTHPKG